MNAKNEARARTLDPAKVGCPWSSTPEGRMAYQIRLFGRCADPVAHHACEELLTNVISRDPLIREVGERHNGLGWISIELRLSADRTDRSNPR